jgi:uncharacterized LabA/DUF88 family protein
MERPREVALFIDFENIRYSVLNTYHRELSGTMLRDMGRLYDLVTVARAYADFEEHPERVQRDLQISGITAVASPSLQVGDRPKGGADMEMQSDIFESLLDRPNLATYILMTGDRRFIRMVTMIRNRYGKEVVVAGVRGSVSNDLIEATGGSFEPLEFEPVADGDRQEAFVRFVDRLERSKPYITFKYVAAAMTTSSEFPGLGEEEAREFVAEAIQEGILVKHQRADGYRVLHLNRDHQDLYRILEHTGGEPEEDVPVDEGGYQDDDYYEDDFDEEKSGAGELEQEPVYDGEEPAEDTEHRESEPTDDASSRDPADGRSWNR